MAVTKTIHWEIGVTLAELEKAVIQNVLVYLGGNKAAAALALGISERTMHYKCRQYEKDDIAEKKKREERKKLETEKRKKIQDEIDASYGKIY